MQKTIKTFFMTVSLIGFGLSTAWAAPEYEYIFKNGTECENTSHDVNVKGMQDIEDKMTQVVVGTSETDMFQQAWLESVNSEEPNKYDGYADIIFIYKSYPNLGMVVAFKDGCYKGHVTLALDALNTIIYQYEVKSKGL